MDDFAGVEPANVQELARRLQRLHSVLAEHGPMIQRTMRQWDSSLTYAALPYLIDEALRDARDMLTRAAKAHDLTREQPPTAAPAPVPPTEPVSPAELKGPAEPASTEPEAEPVTSAEPGTSPEAAEPGERPEAAVRPDSEAAGHGGVQAGQDAGALAEVVVAGDTATAPSLPADLTRRLGDAGYLAAFWGQAFPLALRAARALINRSGPALYGPETAGILRGLGSSLAAATRMRRGTGAGSRPLLPDATLDAIVKHPDQWSVAMLVRYGPEGRSWDAEILAVITRAVLDAHAAGRVDVPERARSPHHDAVAAVLLRAAENGHAARLLLGDPSTCPEHAALLREALAKVSAGEHLDHAGEGELEQGERDQP
jgi:hypothetical protein